ncbi:MAG: hypothetical protein HY545_01480 [Candidatus Doudnabacteria bacterium]|nr:hypothetical protein [Candidatus Doudnabacteria bacterium]
MGRLDFQKIVAWLSYILRCPVCGHKYNLERTRIIDTKDERPALGASLLVHTDCDSCKSSVVFSIAIDGPEIFSIGMVTDLTSADTSKFKNRKPISPDEVIAAHEFLLTFNGDFRSVLR